MSDELSYKQQIFLNDYYAALRQPRNILKELAITADELADWRRKDKAFRRSMRNVELSLGMVREMEIRVAAMEASRMISCVVFGMARFKTPSQFRGCKAALDAARRIDPLLLRRGWRRPLRPADVVDPVHPAYRAQASRLMDEMDRLRAEFLARKRGKKLGDPREWMPGERPWRTGSRDDRREPPNRPPIEDKLDPSRWNEK
jgi:hypothetical protein